VKWKREKEKTLLEKSQDKCRCFVSQTEETKTKMKNSREFSQVLKFCLTWPEIAAATGANLGVLT
jgi:hypothetical protein